MYRIFPAIFFIFEPAQTGKRTASDSYRYDCAFKQDGLDIDFSPLLANFFIGFWIVNLSGEKERNYHILIMVESRPICCFLFFSELISVLILHQFSFWRQFTVFTVYRSNLLRDALSQGWCPNSATIRDNSVLGFLLGAFSPSRYFSISNSDFYRK